MLFFNSIERSHVVETISNQQIFEEIWQIYLRFFSEFVEIILRLSLLDLLLLMT